MSLFSRIRQFDAYTKPMEDFRVKTMTGGFVTLIATVAIIALSISETVTYFSSNVVEQLYVDSTSSDLRVDVNFDLTFHKLSCSFITIDVMDVSSENQDNIRDDIYKLPLDANGNNLTERMQKLEVNQNKTASSEVVSTTPKCGSCYGARDNFCCNTCDDVREAYQAKGWQVNVDEVEQCKSDRWVKLYADHKSEGCRVMGKVQVAKVAGNFHLAPGDPFRTVRSHVHDLHNLDPSKFDTSHTINHFSFGTPFPGKKYPVDGKKFDHGKGGIMYQYYVKVVPTNYFYADGRRDNSHQFSITTHQKDLTQGISGLPGFFVQYEFSPLMVRYEERKQLQNEKPSRPLITFLVSLCAIVGGVFTVAQLIDTVIYQSSRVIQNKLNMNKLG